MDMDHTVLTQKKAPAIHKPATLNKPQNWDDLMARTLDANAMVNSGSQAM